MASFKDPHDSSFTPIEVVERLIEIYEYWGEQGKLFIASGFDLVTYLDSFGFDSYSLTLHPENKFQINAPTTMILPSGDKARNHILAH